MATALIKDQPLKSEELERLSETSLAFVKEALSLEENGLESSVSSLSSLIRSSPNFHQKPTKEMNFKQICQFQHTNGRVIKRSMRFMHTLILFYKQRFISNTYNT